MNKSVNKIRSLVDRVRISKLKNKRIIVVDSGIRRVTMDFSKKPMLITGHSFGLNLDSIKSKDDQILAMKKFLKNYHIKNPNEKNTELRIITHSETFK